MENKKNNNNQFQLPGGVLNYKFILKTIKNDTQKNMTVKETANMIEKIIKKAQNTKLNDSGASQISREEFENLDWKYYPGKDFGMPKVIANLIKTLTGINLYEKESNMDTIQLDFDSYKGNDINTAKDDFEIIC